MCSSGGRAGATPTVPVAGPAAMASSVALSAGGGGYSHIRGGGLGQNCGGWCHHLGSDARWPGHSTGPRRTQKKTGQFYSARRSTIIWAANMPTPTYGRCVWRYLPILTESRRAPQTTFKYGRGAAGTAAEACVASERKAEPPPFIAITLDVRGITRRDSRHCGPGGMMPKSVPFP